MSVQEIKVAAHARARSREAPPPCSICHAMLGSRVCTFSCGVFTFGVQEATAADDDTDSENQDDGCRTHPGLNVTDDEEAGEEHERCSGQHFQGRESEDEGERVSGAFPPPPFAPPPHLLHACHLHPPLATHSVSCLQTRRHDRVPASSFPTCRRSSATARPRRSPPWVCEADSLIKGSLGKQR
jgi:hypothetical protein